MIRIRLLALASFILGSYAVCAHAQQIQKPVAQPAQLQVAFIGDGLTWEWGQTPEFLAHPNWLPLGSHVPVGPNIGASGTQVVLAQLQTIIASGNRPIIHLMVGESNSEQEAENFDHAAIMYDFGQGFDEIITTAQQAKLHIIVGTIPYSLLGDASDLNKWIFIYCATHNVPVINYDFAINSGTGFAASGHSSPQDPPIPPSTTPIPQVPVYWAGTVEQPGSFPYETLSTQGWDLVTDMAQAAIIQVEGYKLKGGYLQTVGWNDDNGSTASISTANVNLVNTGGTVQFTPYGEYSDGSTHIMNNADMYGHLGTWTSTVPKTMYIDPYGVGTGLDLGTSNVKFTTRAGVTLNEWGMTVGFSVYGCDECEDPW